MEQYHVTKMERKEHQVFGNTPLPNHTWVCFAFVYYIAFFLQNSEDNVQQCVLSYSLLSLSETHAIKTPATGLLPCLESSCYYPQGTICEHTFSSIQMHGCLCWLQN